MSNKKKIDKERIFSLVPTFQYIREHKVLAWVIFFTLILVVLIIKLVTLQNIDSTIFFGAYSLLVSFYILSRFGLSYFYEKDETDFDENYGPTVSFAIPCKNEGDHIKETILRIGKTNYPKDKFDIIAVNDGSTDNTLEEMIKAQKEAERMGVKVMVVDWKMNKGKREGMAECIKRSKNDIMVFIDSDSFVEPNTARELVKYFSNKRVGAVAGHAYVANENKNLLTKMQAVRYYVAFKAYKSAEALFGKVTCCSGCCSAYRRKYLLPIVDKWLNQRFLGVKCTYGDDRALTNFLLSKNYKALYSPTAISYTFVPDTFRVFMRQQLRWKKSWTRESLKASTFMWKTNPVMSLSFYIGLLLPLLAPFIVIKALVWYPILNHALPWFYIFGLVIMAVIYGMYYYLHTGDKKWPYGILFSSFSTIILMWQLPYAIMKLKDSSWGTR